jgi:hypothetical protein
MSHQKLTAKFPTPERLTAVNDRTRKPPPLRRSDRSRKETSHLGAQA